MTVDDETVEFVAGSILQGQAYFSAAQTASLQIRPVLLYYGTSNLMAASAVLLRGERLNIANHGMRFQAPQGQSEFLIGQSVIQAMGVETGALRSFTDAFNGQDISNSSWTLEEVMASIPDLHGDYRNCYPDGKPFVIPVEMVQTTKGAIDRIRLEALDRFESASDALSQVPGLSNYYLAPQVVDQSEFVILRRKIGSRKDVGIYSLNGRKFLPLNHVKGRRPLAPPQLLMAFMALYALGMLSRYYPPIWNQFVRNDITGEKLVVERFLDTSERLVPNLVLDLLKGERVVFVNSHQDGQIDLTSSL